MGGRVGRVRIVEFGAVGVRPSYRLSREREQETAGPHRCCVATSPGSSGYHYHSLRVSRKAWHPRPHARRGNCFFWRPFFGSKLGFREFPREIPEKNRDGETSSRPLRDVAYAAEIDEKKKRG